MALTDTLRNGLDRYRIGPKVRELRTRKRMGLAELGAHTGLSAALLSKIERGRMYPTLPTLLRDRSLKAHRAGRPARGAPGR